MAPTTSSDSLNARIRPWDWVLSTASGFLLYAAQPPFSFAALAWVSLVPLLLALHGKNSSRRLLLGLACGTVWSWALVGPWLGEAAPLALPLSSVSAALLSLAAAEAYGGLYVALFAALYRKGLGRGGVGAVAGTAALWVGLELVRERAPGGLPWCLIGHSQWAFPHAIQIAEVTGVYGVSFVIVAANAALAGLVGAAREGRALRAIPGAALGVMLIAFLLAHGIWRLASIPRSRGELQVQVVHTAWDALHGGSAQSLFERLLALTEEVPPQRAQLVIWPENSARFYLQQVPEARRVLETVASRRNQFLLVGGPRLRSSVAGDRFYNSAYLFSPAGKLVATRDKRLLVPLAEASLAGLPSVERPFQRGKLWRPLEADGVRLGVLICFEAIFSEPARVLVLDGARLLVNITNDHLVGVGADQQAAMAVFRTVENRVPLLRVANLGPSLSVDAFGRIVAEEPPEHGTNVWSVQIGSERNTTTYARWGDVFAGGCLAAVCLGFLRSGGTKNRSL